MNPSRFKKDKQVFYADVRNNEVVTAIVTYVINTIPTSYIISFLDKDKDLRGCEEYSLRDFSSDLSDADKQKWLNEVKIIKNREAQKHEAPNEQGVRDKEVASGGRNRRTKKTNYYRKRRGTRSRRRSSRRRRSRRN